MPTRLTLTGLVLIGSLTAAAAVGAGRVGAASICGAGGVTLGLNAWGLRDELLDELQARQVIADRRRPLATILLTGVGFILALVAIVIFFTG